MSDSSTKTVQIQYVREQYTHSTTTVCQKVVHIQYNYSMSESSKYTVQLQNVREQ
jgi:hypothetical protein